MCSLALCLTKWWFICCSVTVPRPGSKATLHRALAGLSPVLSCSGLRVRPGFFHPDTALCLQPRVHSGDTRASALTLPCLGFYQPCLHWGLTAVLLEAPLTPAAAPGVSRASACSSGGFHSRTCCSCVCWASVVWPGDHQGVCTPTTYLCQKLWRHPSPSHLFRLWHGLCAGWVWK